MYWKLPSPDEQNTDVPISPALCSASTKALPVRTADDSSGAFRGTSSSGFAFYIGLTGSRAVSLDDEILARIRTAQAWDRAAKPEDFQLRVAANGSVLINLKTRRAYLIYDEDSVLQDLRDLEELFPNLVFFPKQ